MKLRIFIIVILVSATSLVVAQSSKEERKEAFKATQKAMKTYAKENIIPVIKPIREAFDAKLSAAEQKELAEVRSILEAKKEEMMENLIESIEEFKEKVDELTVKLEAR